MTFTLSACGNTIARWDQGRGWQRGGRTEAAVPSAVLSLEGSCKPVLPSWIQTVGIVAGGGATQASLDRPRLNLEVLVQSVHPFSSWACFVWELSIPEC
jgi:hypothetical protein